MGIESKHPEYKERVSQWQRCRDTADGEDKVKSRGVAYLPKLSGQKDEDYEAYKMRGDFFGAVSRTVDGLTGAVMRINPTIDGDFEWADNVTDSGVSLNSFISFMLAERLLMGRVGVLVDHSGDRPYLAGYTTEQITNWMEGRIVLSEMVLVEGEDEYQQEQVEQLRELVIEEGGYFVRLWQKGKGEQWQMVGEEMPSIKGSKIPEIPFVSVSVDGSNMNPVKPPLLDLANMNLSHYRSSVDLEHGRHFTALPTPYVTGLDEGELKIGSQTAWILPEGSTAGYLEFTGQGLGALEKALEDKRSMMASLGAQLLQQQKNGVEAEGTLRLRQNAEASVLAKSVKDVETGINDALAAMSAWEGKAAPMVKINTDFSDVGLNNQDLTALMGAWQSGGISHDTFLWNLKRGELLPEDRSIDDEKSLIETQGMSLDETV